MCGIMMSNIFLTGNGVKNLWKPPENIGLGWIEFIWLKMKNNLLREFSQGYEDHAPNNVKVKLSPNSIK